jgi:hypothetical protein
MFILFLQPPGAIYFKRLIVFFSDYVTLINVLFGFQILAARVEYDSSHDIYGLGDLLAQPGLFVARTMALIRIALCNLFED